MFTTNVDGDSASDVPLGTPVDREGVLVHYFPCGLLRRLYVSAGMRDALAREVGGFDLLHLHSCFLWPTWAAARQAERDIAAGNYRGALHGIPVGIKDIFDTASILTTHGSSFYRDNIPAEDAASVTLLKQAGAIVLGKCNTHEFAAGSTSNNPWYVAAPSDPGLAAWKIAAARSTGTS